jgi:hypothetical protein
MLNIKVVLDDVYEHDETWMSQILLISRDE